MIKKRNLGIDFLKFLAALLVVNSHIDIMYGNYSAFATGGTIGDILFFFCSGYTLFLKPFDNTFLGAIHIFPNWYKRRINRIWPGLIVVGLLKMIVFNRNVSVVQAFFDHGYWFIDCIMLYYVVIYFIGSWYKWNYKWIYIAVSVATFCWFYLMKQSFGYSMYHPGSIIKWLPYFLLMLMGAQLGKESLGKTQIENSRKRAWKHLILFFIYTAMYYAVLGISTRMPNLMWIQPFSFIPLLPGIYHVYRFASSSIMEGFIRKWYFIIGTIGGLCLEIYFGQYFFITSEYNKYFPLNIIAMLFLTIIFAYFLRCLSRFFAQTFKEAPYDWKAIVKLY